MRRTLLLLAAVAAGLTFAGAPRFDGWKIVGPGGGGGHFIPTISPHDSNRVLVACDMTGSFISHDGGESWRMFNLGNRTDIFAFDPSQPDTIYAKTAGPPEVMAKDRPIAMSGLFRSTDAGKTWRLVRADDASGELMALAVDPTDSQSLYAVLKQAGGDLLHQSNDGGKTWRQTAPLAGGGQAIYIDPRSPVEDRAIYVAGSQAISIREKGQWTTGVRVEGTRVQFAMGFPKQDGQPVAYAITQSAAFVSEDAGRTWRATEVPGLTAPRLRAVATSLRHPNTAYVSYSNSDGWHGVAKTADHGRTWSLVWKESVTRSTNIVDAWLTDRFGPRWGGSPGQLGVAPDNPQICYGTDSGRTMRTTDGGATWKGIYSKREPGPASIFQSESEPEIEI